MISSVLHCNDGFWPDSAESPMKSDPLYVKSIEKAFRVLNAFSTGTQYLGLTEIAQRCNLDKSAAQRFTHTLLRLGLLEKSAKTRRFALGKKVLEFSYNFLRTHPLIEAATPTLIELRKTCGERINLSLFDDTSILYAIRQQNKREFFYGSLTGRRTPVFCTAAGRAILARLPKSQVVDIISRSKLQPLTPKTIVDRKVIYAKIEEARTKGYAVSIEETTIGELVVGAAILDADGQPVAAIQIAASTSEWRPADFEKKFAPLTIETAQTLSRTPLSMNK
jgi:DNA-binding IclR family transcriptional regulator